jgi:broad specificity phosphatase PhoE
MSSLPGDALRTRLILLCRGPVDWARAESGDPPLESMSLRETELLAAGLPHFDVIVASPQRSSQETAEALLAQRPVAVVWRDGLDEIRTAAALTSAEAYTAWLDRLFESYGTAEEGESLAEAAERMTSALRAIADRYYGRSALVVSHPVVLLAFRGELVQSAVQREQVDALPGPTTLTLDYLEGRFYVVTDFPVRLIP